MLFSATLQSELTFVTFYLLFSTKPSTAGLLLKLRVYSYRSKLLSVRVDLIQKTKVKSTMIACLKVFIFTLVLITFMYTLVRQR